MKRSEQYRSSARVLRQRAPTLGHDARRAAFQVAKDLDDFARLLEQPGVVSLYVHPYVWANDDHEYQLAPGALGARVSDDAAPSPDPLVSLGDADDLSDPLPPHDENGCCRSCGLDQRDGHARACYFASADETIVQASGKTLPEMRSVLRNAGWIANDHVGSDREQWTAGRAIGCPWLRPDDAYARMVAARPESVHAHQAPTTPTDVAPEPTTPALRRVARALKPTDEEWARRGGESESRATGRHRDSQG